MEEMASLSVDDESNEGEPEVKIKIEIDDELEMDDATDPSFLPKNVLDMI